MCHETLPFSVHFRLTGSCGFRSYNASNDVWHYRKYIHGSRWFNEFQLKTANILLSKIQIKRHFNTITLLFDASVKGTNKHAFYGGAFDSCFPRSLFYLSQVASFLGVMSHWNRNFTICLIPIKINK